MTVTFRAYDEGRDLHAVTRIWLETGWATDTPAQRRGVQRFFTDGHTSVAELGGEAECAVKWAPGSMQYLDTRLPLGIVAGVTTSRVARLQGVASTLTRRAVAEAATEGAAVVALGMFEQGFYDRFGFGAGSYEVQVQFDPAALQVDRPRRPPVRLRADDLDELHALVARRHRVHGSVAFDTPGWLQADAELVAGHFALGFRDDDGSLTHALVVEPKGEHGPYHVHVLAHRHRHDVVELLGLLRALGDQVSSVKLQEPGGLRIQDLLRQPFADRRRTAGSEHASGSQAVAWWQLRIVDLERTLAALPAPPLRCNLVVSDPLADGSVPWPGLAGDYVLQLGEPSTVEPGRDPRAPTVETSVNALSQLLWGVLPATTLATLGRLRAPEELLVALDHSVRLPQPHVGLYF